MVRGSKKVTHPVYKLPSVPISQFSSLLTKSILQKNLKYNDIYQRTKYLLFKTSHQCVLTNSPKVLFTTFIGGLRQENIQNEVLDILVLLIASKQEHLSDDILDLIISNAKVMV